MVAKLKQIIRNNKVKAFIYKQFFHNKVLLKQRPKHDFIIRLININQFVVNVNDPTVFYPYRML